MSVYTYIIAMAVVTYLIRAVPLVLFRKKIENRFLSSFFYLFNLKGKVHRECPNDSPRDECPNAKPHK